VPGRGTTVAHAAVRAIVPFIERDTSLTPHIAALENCANTGEILAAVENAIGPLLPRTQA
jgi:histidine ammonia-lyase